jgi:hypothetical protein
MSNNQSDKGMFAVVLSDGETWTSLEGCKLVWIPEEAIEAVSDADADDFAEIVEETLGAEVAAQIVTYDLDAVLPPLRNLNS